MNRMCWAASVVFGITSVALAASLGDSGRTVQLPPPPIWSENFDSVEDPALPPFWSSIRESGAMAVWRTQSPHLNSAPNSFVFRADGGTTEDQARAQYGVAINTAEYQGMQLQFYVFRYNFATEGTRLQPLVSDDFGRTWQVLETIEICGAPSLDVQHYSLALPAGWDYTPWLSVAFRGINGTSGLGMTMDSVVLTGTAAQVLNPSIGSTGTRMTITGRKFGAKSGKIAFVGAKASVKALEWTDTQIVCEVSKVPAGGATYAVAIQPALPKGTPQTLIVSGFTVSVPVPTLLSPSDVPSATGGAITIQGNYFGAKRGKVFLRYSGPKGVTLKACKVTSWVMDPTTGVSTVLCTAPPMPAGDYTVVVENAVGSADVSDILTYTP